MLINEPLTINAEFKKTPYILHLNTKTIFNIYDLTIDKSPYVPKDGIDNTMK